MPLRRMKLTGALKKLQPRSPSSCSRYGHKLELQPNSPNSTLVFGEGMELTDDEASVSSVQSLSVPADVPKGFFAVYVGEEEKRYVIPLNYLKLQAFVVLLRRAEEEFGFSNTGAIRLPCDTVFFEHLLWLLRRHLGLQTPCYGFFRFPSRSFGITQLQQKSDRKLIKAVPAT